MIDTYCCDPAGQKVADLYLVLSRDTTYFRNKNVVSGSVGDDIPLVNASPKFKQGVHAAEIKK
jgi:hypothetical protein